MSRDAVWVLTVVFAAAAGWLDWRSRRIPNWLTVPGLVVGIAANSWATGWSGVKTSLLGALLGLGLLLPFVLLRSLGAGDWKLVGALGAFLGPGPLTTVLLGAVFVAGAMAIGLIVYKGRSHQALRNMGAMIGALFSFKLPPHQVSLDNPDALKVPFGVAVALTVILYETAHVWGKV
jgi:prepilin peptidase CpaA